MYDPFNRKINYLRISITDRCNLRCFYCMPSEGIKLLNHQEILRFEEIIEFAKVAVNKRINKIRITGGEPLVRKGVVDFINELSKINGITDLSMTTNGVLLEEFAERLKKAGLQRLNISLDTIDEIKYKEITRGGHIQDVFRGIKAAQKWGLSPIKINCVISKSAEEPDATAVKEFCNKENLQIRFIHQMDLLQGHFSIVEGGEGGNCITCNRLRLSSNGLLRPCLFNDVSIDIRKEGYEKAIDMAISLKPECGTKSIQNKFNQIGG